MNYVGGYDDKWWRLEKRFAKALDRVSDDLRDRHQRWLSLGSPVLVPTPSGDHIRAPIIVRGGPKELPVAYVQISDVRVDGRRVNAIAQRAAELARASTDGASTTPGKDVTITYP